MGQLVSSSHQGTKKLQEVPLFSFFNFFTQIVDHANVFQLPEAMKTTDAFIRSAQDLLFDAVCDVDVDKVPHYISKLKISSLIVFTACRKFHFQAFPRRVTSAGLSNSSKLTF